MVVSVWFTQPSFEMELLHSCVLTINIVVQWNVINHIKNLLRYVLLISIKSCLEKSTLTMTKYEKEVLVSLAFTFWQFDPPLFTLSLFFKKILQI
jgi:hypothetical protein